jgi:hypothetical protein
VRLARWLQSALGLLAISLLLFAVPTQFEGMVPWHVSPGHAIAVVDGVAIVPLVAAVPQSLPAARAWVSSSPRRSSGGGRSALRYSRSCWSGARCWQADRQGPEPRRGA